MRSTYPCPGERQSESFQLLKGLIGREYRFPNKDEAHDFFTRIIGFYKNFNYAAPDSPDCQRYRGEIEELAEKYN